MNSGEGITDWEWLYLYFSWDNTPLGPLASRLAKRRKYSHFPGRREILIIPGKYWEINFHADKMIYGNTFMYAIILISEKEKHTHNLMS